MDEPEGFADFVAANSRALLRSVWLLTGEWASAEDLVQAALAAAWPRWDRAMRNGTPFAYVRAIMTTTYLHWNRRRWTGEQPTEVLPERAAADVYGNLDARRALLDALAHLAPRQRAAVVLRYFLDLTEAETAAELGCSVGAVKSHTSRALTRLRETPGVAEILRGGVAS